MLKFERLGQDATVSIRLKERASFFDKALLQALTWSFIAHLVLFGTFRIRFHDFREPTVSMNAIAVALDPEQSNEMSAFATVSNQDAHTSEMQDDVEPFTSQLDPTEWQSQNLNKLSKLSKETARQPVHLSDHLTIVTSDDLVHASKKVSYAPKVYPLQLKLSHSLRQLSIVEDGSSLFRNKEPYDDTGRLAFSKQHYQVEYKVEVDGISGTISSSMRKHVLLDKELQTLADLLIKKIRFAPFSQKSLKGSLTFNFCCSGDEVRGMLIHD